eukprot:gene29047-36110_t
MAAVFANFCPDYLTTDADSYGDLVDTAIHEIMHGLFFTSDLFQYYIDSDGNALGESAVTDGSQIISSNVVTKAQEQFDCTSVTGAALENEGGSGTSGSHWEMRLFHDEMMVGSSGSQRSSLSSMTLALAQDSGWYTPNYDNAMHLAWGYKEGCSFATATTSCGTTTDPLGDYFCSSSDADAEFTCSTNDKHLGYCAELTLADGCSTRMAFSNTHCDDASHARDVYGYHYGADGRCLPNSLEDIGCYQ